MIPSKNKYPPVENSSITPAPSTGGNPTPTDEAEIVDNPAEELPESPYPEIDNFLDGLDQDELAYLKDKCEALYPEDNTMNKPIISEGDFM